MYKTDIQSCTFVHVYVWTYRVFRNSLMQSSVIWNTSTRVIRWQVRCFAFIQIFLFKYRYIVFVCIFSTKNENCIWLLPSFDWLSKSHIYVHKNILKIMLLNMALIFSEIWWFECTEPENWMMYKLFVTDIYIPHHEKMHFLDKWDIESIQREKVYWTEYLWIKILCKCPTMYKNSTKWCKE